MVTDEQKTELAWLYRRLAAHWGWPLPETWLMDRETIVANIEDGLSCLRALVADQCPVHEHWANTEESRLRAEATREREAMEAA